jgi:hypothetical protein
VLSAAEQQLLVAYANRLCAIGHQGGLVGRTFSAPPKS